MRDHRKLEVFHDADDLTMAVYAATRQFPSDERYGMTSQMRRAAMSVPCNIVEGCARRSERDFAHFLRIGFGSLREVGYLIGLARRFEYYSIDIEQELQTKYDTCARKLAGLIHSIEP